MYNIEITKETDMSERINGIKLNLEKLTDQELSNLIEIAALNLQKAEADLERLVSVAIEREKETA
jgi:hypothetical protein